MFWIALQPSHEDDRIAWGWRALHFTPRVASVDEAVVLEVSACERLWNGRHALAHQLFDDTDALTAPAWAAGATSLVALALLRLRKRGAPKPAQVPDDLPLDVLTAARDHIPTLERIGCRTWGDLRKLPRGGVSRRFGKEMLAALDRAYGDQPETHAWTVAPERFDMQCELPALATSAPELMWMGQRLLSHMQLWLQARNQGVLAMELEWTLDLRRIDGKPLPPTENIVVRTAQPTQDMTHLRRLLSEHLSRATISAPANHLRLRSLETCPWGGISTSLLPEDNRPGEPLHQFIERVSVRLGERQVRVPRLHSDHRPERMQDWVPARAPREPADSAPCDVLYPPWLLPEPQLLPMRGNVPWHGGPLRRLTRLYRVESGWWDEGGPSFRDYFVARSDDAGLVWIFRERSRDADTGMRRERWYLQGMYA